MTDGHPFWALTGVPLEQSCERTAEWIAKGKVTPRWTDAGKLAVIPSPGNLAPIVAEAVSSLQAAAEAKATKAAAGKDTIYESIGKSVARSMGSSLGRQIGTQIVRGVLGGILGGGSKKKSSWW